MNNITLPIMIQTKVIQQQGMTIYYPVVYGLPNKYVQDKINNDIFSMVDFLIQEQYRRQDTANFTEMIGTYEIKTNERNILSLSFSNYAMVPFAAHGLTLMKSLTFNVESGNTYQLQDLFTSNSNYIQILSSNIEKQISERNIQTLEPFTTIHPDQDFYIADKVLVIYFQLYEITTYYIGFPMFPISIFELKDIMAEDGPLAKMATNS